VHSALNRDLRECGTGENYTLTKVQFKAAVEGSGRIELSLVLLAALEETAGKASRSVAPSMPTAPERLSNRQKYSDNENSTWSYELRQCVDV
jgi:hypothetical protein